MFTVVRIGICVCGSDTRYTAKRCSWVIEWVLGVGLVATEDNEGTEFGGVIWEWSVVCYVVYRV